MEKTYSLLKPLTDQLMKEVRVYGILEVSTEQYQTTCNRILSFAQSSQVDHYSPELMDSYKDYLAKKRSSGDICKEYHRFQLRVVRMLSSLDETGVVDFSSKKRQLRKYLVSDSTSTLVEKILDDQPISDATKSDLRAPTRHFLWYAEQRGIKPEFIDDTTVMSFLVNEVPESNGGSTGRTLRCVKYATEYLKAHGNYCLHRDYTLLKLKNDHRRIIPAYSEDEISGIAQAADTDSVLGKRDFAIILVAYCTGLRGIDIIGIKLSDIDWHNQRVSVIQSKNQRFIMSISCQKTCAGRLTSIGIFFPVFTERGDRKMRIKAKDPNLVALMGEFMRTYLPGVRNRDDDTIASYRYSINLFVTYLESENGVTVLTMQASDFNQKNIVGFMTWLKTGRSNVAPTINHRLSDIRGFCRYLYKKHAIALDEYEAIREISDVDDDRVIDFTWLSTNDVRLILNSTESNRNAIRDHFLLSLLYESGARINEVLSLKLLDIKATSNNEADVHFYGKGKKHRITPLSKEIWHQFDCYCEKYHPSRSQEDLVFYTFRYGRQNKMSSDNVSRILEGCEEKVRDSNPDLIHLHSHLFRRTRAMHLYQAGVPLPTISEWLGHSNIETTRFYAKVTEEMKRDALHKLSNSDNSVFKDDVAFKYANDEEIIKRLCGLK